MSAVGWLLLALGGILTGGGVAEILFGSRLASFGWGVLLLAFGLICWGVGYGLA